MQFLQVSSIIAFIIWHSRYTHRFSEKNKRIDIIHSC